MTAGSARLEVFLSNAKKEVFHSVEHRHQIWRENPFDVDSVHVRAREQFQRLLTQATTPPGLESGRVLLLLGESGSGKTHLLRSFRNHVHINGLGFVGYMQMTTASANYSRYLLSNLIDSLDQPYYEPKGTDSGLLKLSTAVALRCGDPTSINALHEKEGLDTNAVVELVEHGADRFIAQPRYADLDLDLVRALLYLQRNDPALKKRVVKYLRCEELSPRDRRLLGDLSSKTAEEDAQSLVEQLGKLMWALDSRSLVICVDQFEEAFQLSDAEGAFRRVMSTLCAVADQVPSSIVVISCLEDYYAKLRTRLTRSTLDRIENDPPPVRLVSERSAEEVEKIIQQRLGYLYETSGITRSSGFTSPDDALYPVPRAVVQRLSRKRTRDVLDWCWRFRENCIDAGRIVEPPPVPTGLDTPSPDERAAEAAKTRLEQEWNDHLAQRQAEPPEEDAKLAELFAWAIQTCADELESGHRFETHVKNGNIEVRILVPTSDGKLRLGEEILVALCNKAPQGGGLGAQIEGVAKQAEKRPLVLIRSGEFPSNPKTAVVKTLVKILEKGARKAVVEDSDWRKIVAFRAFREANQQRLHFMDWLRQENHLSRLLPLIHVLDLDRLHRFATEAAPPARSATAAPGIAPHPPEKPRAAEPAPGVPEPGAPRAMKNGAAPRAPQEQVPPRDAGAIVVGTTGELLSQPLALDMDVLSAHAAFLGSTGSGKTTLALNVVEQLLLCGIPAILIDRKGDLCAYGRAAPWEEQHEDPALDERRRALRSRLDIALFTPGHPEGRQLAISLVPKGLAELKDFDRDQAAGYAAQALGDMLGYKHARKDKSLRAILAQALQLLAAHGNPDKLTLESLITFIADADPLLVNALGRLDTKLFKDLVQDLQTLKLSASDLLSSTSEKLDAELLLGLGAHAQPGRTRLSIINTKFLGDNAKILFWVSQLLLSLTRWVTRAPSTRLQAVVLFDEADVYLPAQSQPATKAPMENLLRRARSGGLGLLLATQSPGDLDYKGRDNIRSWFVGRVTQPVALDKMKPLFSDARVNVADRIASQGVGEFYLLRNGQATAFKAHQALLRTEQVPENEILTLAARRRGPLSR
ncbi:MULTISPECIES: helicase HerA domain-containing protein [Sorangium]|uniref:ATP-binding protein n=1 Tax=Sorangium TaxID=39643 RepID=UPI003D9C40D4